MDSFLVHLHGIQMLILNEVVHHGILGYMMILRHMILKVNPLHYLVSVMHHHIPQTFVMQWENYMIVF